MSSTQGSTSDSASAAGSQGKKKIAEAFPKGLAYREPFTLVSDRGWKWGYEPPHGLYNAVREPLRKHYERFCEGDIDETTVPTYFFCGDPGSGKSRNATDFSDTLVESSPHGSRLRDRLKGARVFHVGFKDQMSLISFEFSSPLEAIGVRMLHHLLENTMSLDEIRETYVAPTPIEVFGLVAQFEGGDLDEWFTGVLVVDDLHFFIKSERKWMDEESFFHMALSGIGDTAANAEGVFIIPCCTSSLSYPVEEFFEGAGRQWVNLPV